MNLPGELASLNFVDFARHLWKRRYVLLLIPPVVVILAYLFIRTFGGETFEANAVLMVRTPPTEILPAQKALAVETPVYEDILASDEIIRQVIDEAREKYPNDISATQFERIRRRFKVEVIATVDTTIRTEYSPVISMSVRGSTRELAHFLADRWVELAVERFGKLRLHDAQTARDAYQEEYDRLGEKSGGLQAREVNLEGEGRQLANRIDVLTRALTAPPAQGRQTGLLEAMLEAQLSLERAEILGDEDSEELTRLELRARQASAAVERVEGELKDLREQKATVDSALENVRKDLVSARERMAETRVILTRVASDSVALRDPRFPEMQGDFLVLSRPVMPEFRVAPARTVLAIIIGIASGFLLIFLVLGEWFIKRAILED
ncbi:MAG: hypothetical protein JJU11_17405 [Candidatus Sumerlaeia bacterium]|nr:hypothetical protein [Candidatus Sumerlaeia bacterium]